jgi:hypothetical protein
MGGLQVIKSALLQEHSSLSLSLSIVRSARGRPEGASSGGFRARTKQNEKKVKSSCVLVNESPSSGQVRRDMFSISVVAPIELGAVRFAGSRALFRMPGAHGPTSSSRLVDSMVDSAEK